MIQASNIVTTADAMKITLQFRLTDDADASWAEDCMETLVPDATQDDLNAIIIQVIRSWTNARSLQAAFKDQVVKDS